MGERIFEPEASAHLKKLNLIQRFGFSLTELKSMTRKERELWEYTDECIDRKQRMKAAIEAAVAAMNR